VSWRFRTQKRQELIDASGIPFQHRIDEIVKQDRRSRVSEEVKLPRQYLFGPLLGALPVDRRQMLRSASL
jgi:hypothetical protein